MSEFDCFCSGSEFVALLQGALKVGYRIQVKMRLLEPTPVFLSSEEEIESAMRQGNVFVLLERADVSRYPVGLVNGKNDGGEYWYPRSSVGGPVIEVGYWAAYEKDDKWRVPSASVAFHSKIENPLNGQLESAGDAIRKAYAELIKPLRKTYRKVKSTKRTAHVSPGADALLNSGWVLREPFG